MVPQERMRLGGRGAGGIDDLVPSSCASLGCSRSFRLFVPCPPPGDVPPAQRASDHDHRAPGHRGSPDGGPRGGPGGDRSPALRAARASGTRGSHGQHPPCGSCRPRTGHRTSTRVPLCWLNTGRGAPRGGGLSGCSLRDQGYVSGQAATWEPVWPLPWLLPPPAGASPSPWYRGQPVTQAPWYVTAARLVPEVQSSGCPTSQEKTLLAHTDCTFPLVPLSQETGPGSLQLPSQSWGRRPPQPPGRPSQRPSQDTLSITREGGGLHTLSLPEVSDKCACVKLESGRASCFNRVVSR